MSRLVAALIVGLAVSGCDAELQSYPPAVCEEYAARRCLKLTDECGYVALADFEACWVENALACYRNQVDDPVGCVGDLVGWNCLPDELPLTCEIDYGSIGGYE